MDGISANTDAGSLTLSELKDYIKGLEEPSYRAAQIFSWIHERRVTSFDEMTDISKKLREKLKEDCFIPFLETEERLISKIDGTRKYLFKTRDGEYIETVLMRYEYGVTICVSTQVGCAMGCVFCASGIDGRKRNLSAYEILSQIYTVSCDIDERIGHVVVMGMGEPLDNYDNVVRFIRLLTDERGYNLSARNITVSTCGIVPGIKKLSEEGIPLTLALSLHASDQATREKIMPVAKRYGLDEVLKECDEYFKKTGRRVTYEYALIDSVNDTDEHARALGALFKGKDAHINIIPVNPGGRDENFKSSRKAALEFKKKLEKYKINATIRRETGRDINGACGQLRSRHNKEQQQLS